MAKQLNVNLAFTADTAKAKAQLKDLQRDLTNLINNTNKGSGMLDLSEDIQKASVAAATLKNQLTDATNVNTGKLDLGKFSQSLKQSGYQIKDYREALLTLGPDGDRVFSQLAQSIMMAEVPLRRSNALLGQFWVTLKNTARWQISSGILHGFMGTLQHAYGYAQDLNESLNNIRIVTGKSTDEMAKFANEANKAAQALSTTTTEYTDAALIYYQQGLSDEEVKTRTDVTVKMANVSRQSAEEVSDQMTAIWNNFYDGSKSLEYYADTITALGAATASSSEEISEGLEKFASVADTVGLSYEYATAALATVTATTRQSADIVGNAFKTLFARLEGLQLGETLDDGTTLNKYSEALDAVGISIKDTSGDMKEMDDILDELGAKWQTLSKDQQIALAQTVAGVRQYTQLIALMDNWDFFNENVKVARNASGTLQEQADIYAESWEAARDRVKAASEQIYSQLLNDDFFIDLNDALTKSLNLLSDFIRGIGGLKGVLLALGAVALGVFKNQIADGLQNVIYNLSMMTKAGQQKIFQLRNETAEALKSMYIDIENPFLKEAYVSQAQAQEILLKNARNMTEEQQKIAQLLMDQHNTLVQNVAESEKIVEVSQEKINSLAEKQKFDIYNVVSKDDKDKAVDLDIAAEKYKDVTLQATKFSTIVKNLFPKNNDSKYYLTQLEKLKTLLGEDAGLIEYFGKNGANAFTLFEEKIREAEDDPKKLGDAIDYLNRKIKDFNNESFKLENELKQEKVKTREFTTALEENGRAVGQSIVNTIKASQSIETFESRLNKIRNTINKNSISIVSLARSLSTVAMSINNFVSLIDTINNKDLSFFDKTLSVVTTLGFTLPMLVSAFNLEKIKTEINNVKAADEAYTVAVEANSELRRLEKEKEIITEKLRDAQENKSNAQKVISNNLTKKEINSLDKLTDKILKNAAAQNISNEELTKDNILKLAKKNLTEEEIRYIQASIGVKNAEIASSKIKKEVTNQETIAEERLTEAKIAGNKATMGGKVAMALLKPEIMAVAAVLALAAGGILLYAKHLEKVAEEQKKAAEEASNLAKENSEQIKQNEELIKSYNDLISQYNKGYIQKEDLWDVTNKLSDAYDIEGGAIAKLTGQYDAFTEAVRKARLEEIEQQKQSAKNAVDANTLGAVAAGSKGLGTSYWTGGSSYSFDLNKGWLNFIKDPTSFISNDFIRNGIRLALPESGLGNLLDEVLPEDVLGSGITNNLKGITTVGKIRQAVNVVDNLSSIINAFEEEGNLIGGTIEANKILSGVREKEFREVINKAGGTEGVLSIEDITSSSDVLNYYKSLEEAKRIAIEENGWKETDKEVMALKEEIEQMKPYIKEIEDNAEALNQSIIQELAETANIANEEDIQKVNATIKEMKDILNAEGINLSEEDRDELIDQYLSGLGNKVINRALAEQELIQDGVSEAVAEAFLNLNLSDEELIAFIRLGFRVNDYETVEALMEAVENYQVLAKNYNLKVDIPLELSTDINKANFNGEEISEDLWKSLEEPLTSVGLEDTFGSREEFNNKPIEERIYLMDQLNKKVAEYSAEIIAVSEEERKLAQEQIETNQKEIDSNKERIEWLEEHSFLRAHNEKYQKEFEDLTQRTELLVNANKELEASINAQAAGESYLKAEINDVLGDIDRLKTSISLIGEDWTVPVENVEQFAALMPEIISQVQELQWAEEGGIKLTQEQIDLVLSGNQQILESNKQIVIDAIESKITQLELEKQYHERNIEYLKMALEDKSKTNKAMRDIDESTQQYAKDLKDAGVQVDSAAWTQMVQNSYDGSKGVVTNLDAINEKIKVIHENYNKMLVKDADMGDYNFEGALANIGDQSWTSSVKIDSAWEEDDENYQALINQLDIEKAAVESIDKSISEYLGAEAKIRASNKEIEDAIKGGPESSSSSSKEKQQEFKDYLDDVEDRYYDINNAISAVNEELEKQEQLEKQLSSLQSHYAGKTLIDSLKQENTLIRNKNGLLEKQFTNYEKVYELQSQELADLKAQIGGEWEGNILQNYTELFQANLDAYNSAIDTYNAMSAEQQEESGKQMIEDAKTAYDEYKNALERYQDLYYNEMYDTENKLAELRQQQLENQIKIIENNLKGWEIEVDLKLDKTDLERDLNDFFNEVQQDFRKIYKNISIDSTFDTKNFNTYLTDVETRMSQIRDVEAEIDKMNRSKGADGKIQLSDDMMFGSIEEAQEKLKELQKEFTSTGKNLQDLYEQVWDNYIDGLDQAKDNFEDLNKEFKHLTNELEYEKELIELVYGDKAFDLMNKYYTTQQRSIENQIASTRTQAEFWEDQFNKAYQMNKDKHNVELEDMSTWTEDMRKAYDEMISSQEQLNDLVIEGIKNVRDEYLNNVAKTFSDMDKALWGMDFTDVKDDWDFIQKKADEYLDDVEGAYQIQTLANKIDNSIAEANSLKAQQKLAALRDDEINFLREKKNLTQDDIDIAEARYQIALKELALEDAQNNKTSMKLTRDTSGNWTYQYVADEEDVKNKQQELLDSYNELYKIADDAYAHAMELAMNTYEEFREKMQEIAEDTTLSEEEKYLKMQELQELYLPEINAAVENAGIYEQETLMAGAAVFAEVCDQDAEAYLTLTDLQKTLVDEVKDQHLEDYEEIRAAILNDYDEIGIKAEETFKEMNLNSQTATADIISQWDTNPKTSSVKGAMQDAFDNIVKYTQNFELELMRLEQVSGKTILDQGGVVDDLNQVGLKVDEVANKTDALADTASANLSTLRGFVNEVEDAWDGVISKIEAAISALQKYLSMMGSPVGTPSISTNISDLTEELKEKMKNYNKNDNSNISDNDSVKDKTKQILEQMNKNNSDAWTDWMHKSNYTLTADPFGVSGTWGVWDSKNQKYVEIGSNREHLEDKYGKMDYTNSSTYIKPFFNNGQIKGFNNGNSTNLILDEEENKNTNDQWEWFRKYTGLATGGYTGEWGDASGRLAVLHEKELVLNAQDTENMLDAVKAVRSISGLNDSISETIAKSISGLVAAAFGINTNNINSAGGDNTSNVYNITAEFPNADDVQTIRDAILSLPNLASQYVYEN